MRIVVTVDTSALARNPRAIAAIAREYLKGTILTNRLLMRLHPIPPLYESGVVYAREPWAGKMDEFADCKTVLARGFGDCEDLAAYRVAELQEAGDSKAGIKIYWRRLGDGSADIYHAEVRRGDGVVEDPSRLLGMAANKVG